MSNVILYSYTICPYCVRAKELLKKRGVSFEEIVVDRNDVETVTRLKRESGMQTFPQIFADKKLIGGYTELAALDEKNKLEELKA
jgi:glutaredoxin 3